jgi:hypothetical protein
MVRRQRRDRSRRHALRSERQLLHVRAVARRPRRALALQDPRPDLVAAGRRRGRQPPLPRQQQPARALGDNTFGLDATTGEKVWSHGTDGTIAASPLLTQGGRVVVGGFDGFVRAYDAATGVEAWAVGLRDHVYASPGELPDGTIVQPSADGSVYGLDPATGATRWQFDTRDAIRSSPAIDGDGNVYVGAGDGRVYVINPDGTLRWSMQLIEADRDDLNASPGLGPDAIVIAGETGEVFSIPYDWCLRDAAASDARCRRGPGEDLPDAGAALYFTTKFGRQLDAPPSEIDANQPLTFSLFVRAAGDTILAHIDAPSTTVTLTPPLPARIEVSGDRKFLTVVPTGYWPEGGTLSVHVAGQYLVNPTREGLRFSGGEVGGTFDQTFTFDVRALGPQESLPFPVPEIEGNPAGVWQLSRVAAPLPTILRATTRSVSTRCTTSSGSSSPARSRDAPSRGWSAPSSPRDRTPSSSIPRPASCSRSR